MALVLGRTGSRERVAGSQGVLCAASSVAIKAKGMRAVILLATGAAQTELRGNKV